MLNADIYIVVVPCLLCLGCGPELAFYYSRYKTVTVKGNLALVR